MSTQKKTILETLSEIQQELKAPKDLRNNFGGYNYRSAESILEAVKPLLGKHGAIINITDELVFMGERYYIAATASITTSDGSISATSYAREEAEKKGMDGAQITGAASSYARKYALNGLLAIDDTKDPDATNTHGKSVSQAAANKAPQATQTAKAAKATPAKEKAAETQPKQAEAAKPAKVETKQTDPKAKLVDDNGNLQPNTAAVEPTPDAERKTKAKAYFKKLTDEATALKFLIKEKGIRSFARVDDFVDGTDTEEVLKVYKELREHLGK